MSTLSARRIRRYRIRLGCKGSLLDSAEDQVQSSSNAEDGKSAASKGRAGILVQRQRKPLDCQACQNLTEEGSDRSRDVLCFSCLSLFSALARALTRSALDQTARAFIHNAIPTDTLNSQSRYVSAFHDRESPLLPIHKPLQTSHVIFRNCLQMCLQSSLPAV